VSAAFSLYARGQNYGFGTEILGFMGREESIFWPLAYEFGACLFHTSTVCVISGFCREAAEKCALLSYYVATSGNFLEITSSGCLITQKKTHAFTVCVISCFCREVAEKCALRSYYAGISGNFLEIS
jgi:hypothetical protein